MVVIVTSPSDHGAVVTTDLSIDPRRSAELEASAPRDRGLYAQLLDQAVHTLAAQRAEPSSALFVAGEVVRGTPWASHKTGRARLATAAAVYLTWLAPSSPWTYDGAEIHKSRRAVRWEGPGGRVVIDVLVANHRDKAMAQRILQGAGDEVAAVRALNLSSPNTSTVFESGGAVLAIAESSWSFTPEVRR